MPDSGSFGGFGIGQVINYLIVVSRSQSQITDQLAAPARFVALSLDRRNAIVDG